MNTCVVGDGVDECHRRGPTISRVAALAAAACSWLRKIASCSRSSTSEKPWSSARRSSCSPACSAPRQLSARRLEPQRGDPGRGCQIAGADAGLRERRPGLQTDAVQAPAPASRRPAARAAPALLGQTVGPGIERQDDVERDGGRQARVAEQQRVEAAIGWSGVGRRGRCVGGLGEVAELGLDHRARSRPAARRRRPRPRCARACTSRGRTRRSARVVRS